MSVRISFKLSPGRETDADDVPGLPTPKHPRRRFPTALVTWAVGAGLLLCLAVTVVITALSWPDEGIPPNVAADQQARTELAASEVQRALDGGGSDLAAVASGIKALTDTDTPNRLLAQLVSTRTRYRGAAYLAPTGEVRASAGAGIDTTATATAPAVLVRTPHVYVSVPVTGAQAGVLVAELTSDTMTTPLSLAGPGTTHLFDSNGRDVGATADTAAIALPAAQPGYTLRDGDGHPTVVSWAPVPGQAGLTVVTDRPEPPRTKEKRELLLLGVLIATLCLVIFGWFYARIIVPLSALAKAADRLARGDSDDPVIVHRYDQLGLVARDLERIRRHLLRRT